MTARGGPPKTQAEWFGEQAYEAWQAGQVAIAAGRLEDAGRWLERACRFAPEDIGTKLSLAALNLRRGDRGAAAMFTQVVQKHDVREAWLGLAAAEANAGHWAAAAAALARAFAGHVLPLATDIDGLASRIARGAGAAGWCCVRTGGVLHVRLAPPHLGKAVLRLDGASLSPRRAALPPDGDRVEATRGGVPLLGSPLSLVHLRRVEGAVEVVDGGLAGWAWHPADPETDPVLSIRPERGDGLTLTAVDTSMVADRPMARPRRFAVAAEALRHLPGLLRIVGGDGRDLVGSPADPDAGRRQAAAAAREIAGRFAVSGSAAARPAPGPEIAAIMPPAPAALIGVAAAAPADPARSLAIVVPVYRDAALTLACLAALRATMPEGSEVIVVDDATPELDLAAALDRLAARRDIRLLRHPINLGFPAAANAGLRAAAALAGGRDVVLLNSDALLTAGALAALRAVVHAAGDIGTATPLSNEATIASYPDRAGGNPMPDARGLAALGRLAARANAGLAVDIPTAVGFCMYLRRECLDQVGLFRDDLFAQGYGEENDFCIRARHLGWRSVAAPGAFVGHAGGRSFGDSRHARIARNLEMLERLHPGYHALVAAHQAADPLAAARRNLDAARWAAARRRGQAAAILVTHDSGGGVERVVRQRCETLRREGLRPILLRPVRDPDATSADDRFYRPGLCEVAQGEERGYPNLRFDIPAELPLLARLLRPDRLAFLEIHHLLGHDHAVTSLAALLGIPWDVHVHDYAWFCPRITLLGAQRRYCGEPAEAAVCEACIADLGRNDEQDIPVAALRVRSARDLGGARQVSVPSADAATRLRRHFPGLTTRVTPLEDDADLPPARSARRDGPRRVCVVGGIGPEKGYDVLLACARDAAARGLALEFVVVGHTVDDSRLLATARVFVTGPYRDERAVEEIAAQDADIAFLPSIWPETWCYTLGHAWRAGLHVAAFDIGAPAERIRRTGRGWLLPLGLPPASINNALLAAQAFAGDECAAVRPA